MFNLKNEPTSIDTLLGDRVEFNISDEDAFWEAAETGEPVYVWICPYASDVRGKVLIQWDIDLSQAREREREARQDI